MAVLAMSHCELGRFDTLQRLERDELLIEDAAALRGVRKLQADPRPLPLVA